MVIRFNIEDINNAAADFIAATHSHRVFAFSGEMGAGKTTFIQAICSILGVKENMGSPTFSIINQYQSLDGHLIYHLDLYRIKSSQEAMEAGVEEVLYSGNYCFVEWPEKAKELFPDDTLHVSISIEENGERKIKVHLPK